ncbi:MAG: capsular polysaccharide biosynthesis protein, partial [Rhodobacteraceae bacterium]|nr:capsular polysaccharide biosynthesis protein [Paracoccaceae bacterium]
MLKIAGWDVCFGPFCRDAAAVGVWGRKPLAKRGFAAAKRRDLPVVSIEDAFLRSNHPGPATAPCGLIIDEISIYFDASKPSRLENILNGDGLDDPLLLARAHNGIAFLKASGLSKYNPVPRSFGQMPDPGYVLVIDQTAGDASIKSGNASAETFHKMLAAARAENPDKPIVIRSHPAVKSVRKSGHFSAADCDKNTVLQTCRINPWDLLEGADSVYCVTSQLGFEAILAGHKPRVFGMPFYAGWGLSQDEQHLERRVKTLTAEQLFAGAMLEYPVWIDGFQGRQCSFETAAQFCQAKAKMAWMALPKSVALGMSNWKIPQVSNFLGYDSAKPEFAKTHKNAMQRAAADSARIVVWASKLTPEIEADFEAAKQVFWRMEDGFLRSAGLGAELTPADSMVLDDVGIYYDATGPSTLEQLISASADLPDYALQRAKALQQQIVEAGVTKYNLNGDEADFPASDKTIILVPGQVEDDASIRLG